LIKVSPDHTDGVLIKTDEHARGRDTFFSFHRKIVRERSTIDRDMSLGVDLNCFDFIIIILNSIYGLECVD
jgi:hypothetical protein